ncbi:hypothetical protein KVT40_002562 [Elsinoe batatas]|uniref:Uncharacterized protein n=1 Tax=Elsinoe batatas TaxID=2601811 RepID=A0A8K0PHM7_9PEZI|nr:hypothetical protein KVT40_002562 [Elsinoe batatas]
MQPPSRLGIFLLLAVLLSFSSASPLPAPRGIGGVIVKGLADGLAAGAQDAWSDNRQAAATAKDTAASSLPSSSQAWKPTANNPLVALALAAGINFPLLIKA